MLRPKHGIVEICKTDFPMPKGEELFFHVFEHLMLEQLIEDKLCSHNECQGLTYRIKDVDDYGILRQIADTSIIGDVGGYRPKRGRNRGERDGREIMELGVNQNLASVHSTICIETARES
ncbi:hypothetical protein AZ34_02345 [Hylemonella gracilis str. Niagara R]|uniref:Uncharacterized protein n=1 Tax=Hylemonella gracilis str. Niagara R TaxID=1458275 RepID=A0A016XLN7_9BURK|nr:hypothetical protein AZ34_02345 [Hylemonella gracilis str. Niagara R]